MIELSKRTLVVILCVGVFLLNGCLGFGGVTPTSFSPTTSTAPASTTEPVIEATAEIVARAEIPTTTKPADGPTATLRPSPTPTLDPDARLSLRLSEAIEANDWPVQGLDPALASSWEQFSRQGGDLGAAELEMLEQFLDRWDLLQQAAEMARLPGDADLTLRVEMLPEASGMTRPVLYAVVGGQEESEETQLFLLAHDTLGEVAGLAAAPIITGLEQRIGADGWLVEYVDPQKERVMLRADAHKLDLSRQADELLKRRLDEVYLKNSPFTRGGIYPRYYFPVEGVGAGFYLVEKSLTFQQILQLNEAFSLFERPNMVPLKTTFFGAGTSVVIVEQMEIAAGLTYAGTGVIELDRRDLFGNKYYLAEVLAHEGSHVLQGNMAKSAGCDQALKREVGDQKIPADFFTWTGDQLIDAVRKHTIGAYHVSLWVLNEVGLRGRDIDLLREVIQTGQMFGQSLVPFCKE